jgi:hypothetical protein
MQTGPAQSVVLREDKRVKAARARRALRVKVLEAGRLRVLLRHTRSPLDGEARAVRLDKVEAEIKLLRKRTGRIEAKRRP